MQASERAPCSSMCLFCPRAQLVCLSVPAFGRASLSAPPGGDRDRRGAAIAPPPHQYSEAQNERSTGAPAASSLLAATFRVSSKRAWRGDPALQSYLAFFEWSPDYENVMQKMLYACSKDSLKKKLRIIKIMFVKGCVVSGPPFYGSAQSHTVVITQLFMDLPVYLHFVATCKECAELCNFGWLPRMTSLCTTRLLAGSLEKAEAAGIFVITQIFMDPQVYRDFAAAFAQPLEKRRRRHVLMMSAFCSRNRVSILKLRFNL